MQAIQWLGNNYENVLDFISPAYAEMYNEELYINKMKVNISEYIIKVKDDFYTFKEKPVLNPLQAVFDMQAKLNLRIIPDLAEQLQDETQAREWFLAYARECQLEMSEAIETLGHKFWKQDRTNNWDECRKELVDVLHFFVSMCQVAGITADELINMYMEKNKINHERQDNDY